MPMLPRARPSSFCRPAATALRSRSRSTPSSDLLEHLPEEGEAEVALLHVARVLLGRAPWRAFRGVAGTAGMAGSPMAASASAALMRSQRSSALEGLPQRRHGGGGRALQLGERLAGAEAGFEARGLEQLRPGRGPAPRSRRARAIAARSRTIGDQLPRHSKSWSPLSLS